MNSHQAVDSESSQSLGGGKKRRKELPNAKEGVIHSAWSRQCVAWWSPSQSGRCELNFEERGAPERNEETREGGTDSRGNTTQTGVQVSLG